MRDEWVLDGPYDGPTKVPTQGPTKVPTQGPNMRDSHSVGTWWDPVGNYYYPLISSYLTREYLNKYGHIRSTYSAHSVENRLLHVQERSVTAIVIFE